ncbi:hypothetical protein Tco_1080407 [Tanacetum coccineum]|uniref:Uncharacterized protein n=1 Tax=Tanacetum coccineum TaxID=301880 RepID=A0ABQ5HUL6_9ASTR
MVKNIELQWNIEGDKGVSVKYTSGTNNGQQHVALSAIQNVVVQQVSPQGMITSPNTSGVQEIADTFATAAYVIRESPHNTCHKGSKSNALGTISYRRFKMVNFCHELGDGYGVHCEGWQWCSRTHATTTYPHDAMQTSYRLA